MKKQIIVSLIVMSAFARQNIGAMEDNISFSHLNNEDDSSIPNKPEPHKEYPATLIQQELTGPEGKQEETETEQQKNKLIIQALIKNTNSDQENELRKLVSSTLPKENWFLRQLPSTQDVLSKKIITTESVVDLLKEVHKSQEITIHLLQASTRRLAYTLKSDPTTLYVYDRTNKTLKRFPTMYNTIYDMKISEDGATLALAGEYSLYRGTYGLGYISLISQNNGITYFDHGSKKTTKPRIGGIYTNLGNLIIINKYETYFETYNLGQHLSLKSIPEDDYIFTELLDKETVITISKKSIKVLKPQPATQQWTATKTIPVTIKRMLCSAAVSSDHRSIATLEAAITMHPNPALRKKQIKDVCVSIIDLETGKKTYSFKVADSLETDQLVLKCLFMNKNNLLVQLPHALTLWHVEDGQMPYCILQFPSSPAHSLQRATTMDELYLVDSVNEKALSISDLQMYSKRLQKSDFKISLSVEQKLFLECLLKKLSLQAKASRTAQEQKELSDWIRILYRWLTDRKTELGFTEEQHNACTNLVLTYLTKLQTKNISISTDQQSATQAASNFIKGLFSN